MKENLRSENEKYEIMRLSSVKSNRRPKHVIDNRQLIDN